MPFLYLDEIIIANCKKSCRVVLENSTSATHLTYLPWMKHENDLLKDSLGLYRLNDISGIISYTNLKRCVMQQNYLTNIIQKRKDVR